MGYAAFFLYVALSKLWVGLAKNFFAIKRTETNVTLSGTKTFSSAPAVRNA